MTNLDVLAIRIGLIVLSSAIVSQIFWELKASESLSPENWLIFQIVVAVAIGGAAVNQWGWESCTAVAAAVAVGLGLGVSAALWG